MTVPDIKPPKPKEVAHDETPSIITDHPFEPKGEWWSLCGHKNCNLARSAHKETAIHFQYLDDEMDD
jgi:hypothetical protein